MSYGLIIRNASGVTIFSSEEQLGGVFVQTVILGANTSGSIYFDGTGGYPNLIGRSIRVVEVGPGAHNWSTVQNAPGAPYISYTHRSMSGRTLPAAANTKLRVFAL